MMTPQESFLSLRVASLAMSAYKVRKKFSYDSDFGVGRNSG